MAYEIMDTMGIGMKGIILGAGELGATLAGKLAETGLFREIVLFDNAPGTAQGKALDLLESGPILGFRTRLSGSASLEAIPGADLIVTAGLFQGDGQPIDETRAGAFFQSLAPRRGDSVVIIAEEYGTRLAEIAVLQGRYSPRAIIGSAPLARASALRAKLAQELHSSARDIHLPLLGRLPAPLIVPWSMVSLSGVPIEKRVHVSVLRRLSNQLQQPARLGPYVLASAAAALASDLIRDRRATQPVLAYLKGEYQQRDRFLVVPSRLGRRGVLDIPELALDPVDRSALERLRQG